MKVDCKNIPELQNLLSMALETCTLCGGYTVLDGNNNERVKGANNFHMFDKLQAKGQNKNVRFAQPMVVCKLA